MNGGELKLYYILSCVVLSLIILSPAIINVVPFPAEETFSEIWILGPDHIIGNVPLAISANTVYTVYLDVGNHMGELKYYAILAKIRNQSEPLPDTTAGNPSPLTPIFEYRLFTENNEISERTFDFSFQQVLFNENTSRISQMSVNGDNLDLDKTGIWDPERDGFYYQLFFELWLYNSAAQSFEFHNRYVQFWLNMTQQT